MRRGLTIVVSGSDADRLRSALGLAAAEAALGGRVRLFLDAAAVRVLRSPPDFFDPMVEASRDLGVRLLLCQTGLSEQGVAPDPRFDVGGLVSLLAELGEDRLLLA